MQFHNYYPGVANITLSTRNITIKVSYYYYDIGQMQYQSHYPGVANILFLTTRVPYYSYHIGLSTVKTITLV